MLFIKKKKNNKLENSSMHDALREELNKVNNLLFKLEMDKENGKVSKECYENTKKRLENLKRELEGIL